MSTRELHLIQASTIKSRPVRWLWKDFIPLGKLTVLAGEAGKGKSTLTHKLASQVSVGSAAGDLMMAPADVLIASAEDDPEDTIQPRLRAHTANLDRIHLLDMRCTDDAGHVTPGFIELPGDVHTIANAVRQSGCKLIILDPVVAYLDPGKSAYREQHVREALGPLRVMASETGAAVLTVMHLNKGDGSNPLQRIGNSGAFTALARSVLVFGRDPTASTVSLDAGVVNAAQQEADNEGLRVLASAKSNLGRDGVAVRFRMESVTIPTSDGHETKVGRLEELGPINVSAEDLLTDVDPDEPSALGDAMEWLKDVLANGPMLSNEVRAAAKEAGHSWRTVTRAKKTLKIAHHKMGADARTYWMLAIDRDKLTRPGELGQPPTQGKLGQVGQVGVVADCSNADHHHPQWTKHPETGHPVCPICHPLPKPKAA